MKKLIAGITFVAALAMIAVTTPVNAQDAKADTTKKECCAKVEKKACDKKVEDKKACCAKKDDAKPACEKKAEK